ncbi:hypothetical protein Bca4012_026994 [Brassica carinata]
MLFRSERRWFLEIIYSKCSSFVKVRSDEKLLKQVMEQAKESVREMGKSIDAVQTITSEKLFLQGNGLSDESIQWEGIASPKRLMFLSISHNKLTVLPSEFEIFKSNNNRITNLPESIGDCSFLMEVDLSANMLSELPETVTKLSKLKTLELNNTGLTTLPYVLFKMCLQLSTLGLHNTKITVETLRQVCLF